ILIGVAPTAYALNRAMPDTNVRPFVATATYAGQALDRYAGGRTASDPRAVIGTYLRTRQSNPEVVPALAQLSHSIGTQVQQYGSLRKLPQETVQNVRNDMYLTSEALKRLAKDTGSAKLAKADVDTLNAFRKELEGATRFIPTWVKIAVAIAL